jgi:hypothetical protein
MQEIGDLGAAYAWEAGVLVDLSTRRVLWFGDPTTEYVGESEGDAASDASAWREKVQGRWRGFELEEVGGADDLRAYLDARGAALPRVVSDEELRPIEADDGGEARREELRAKEEACSAEGGPARDAERRGGGLAAGCLLVPLLVAALLARLVLAPFRGRLRERMRRRGRERRADALRAAREALARAEERLKAAPDDLAARIDRALCLPPSAAERELDACVGRGEASASDCAETKRLLALAVHDRGVMRARLGLKKLAAADAARARALGLVPKARAGGRVRIVVGLGVAAFLSMAGLDPDE